MTMENKVVIEKLDDLGNGIAHINNKVCFIPNALPGEIGEVEITEEKKKYLKGKLIHLDKPSGERIEPSCPYFKKCGGCSLGHLNASTVLEYKKEKVQNIILKNTNKLIEPLTIESNNIYNYRNKITLKIENYKWGYYSLESHNFVAIDECLLAREPINKVIANKDFLQVPNGEITIRCNDKKEILISVVTKEKYQLDITKLADLNIKGIIINDKTVYGDNYFYHKINDYTFKISYNAFFQVNDDICSKLFNVLNSFDLKGILLDLYCGVGSLGISMHKQFKKIYGIELVENAIKDAKINANLNKVENAHYICGLVKDTLNKIKEPIDTLLVDPPRKGLDNIEELTNFKAQNIMYISCDPITLGRDLNYLCQFYEISKVYVLNMFPNTYHVESLVLLKLKV